MFWTAMKIYAAVAVAKLIEVVLWLALIVAVMVVVEIIQDRRKRVK